ncbi:helix-turn-helix domain-containing protein [Avibacterium paragallinarum]|uniref:DNA binding domain, excisionase family n=1 Tax=uncultured Avibacterium sp. TaxID=1936169 RepID=A0A486XDP6_9PAST|nr:DNA binding domain, excisionase family [uncultured Avibacterium sp.]
MNEMRETDLCKHYTVKEMAELFGVSRGKLDRLARQGKIKKTKFGNSTLYSAQEVQRYLASANQ